MITLNECFIKKLRRAQAAPRFTLMKNRSMIFGGVTVAYSAIIYRFGYDPLPSIVIGGSLAYAFMKVNDLFETGISKKVLKKRAYQESPVPDDMQEVIDDLASNNIRTNFEYLGETKTILRELHFDAEGIKDERYITFPVDNYHGEKIPATFLQESVDNGDHYVLRLSSPPDDVDWRFRR